MDSNFLEGLRKKYIINPPEGMTPKLVKGISYLYKKLSKHSPKRNVLTPKRQLIFSLL